MTAVKDMFTTEPRITIDLRTQEAYATDGFGMVITPARVIVPARNKEDIPATLVFRMENVKIPKKATVIHATVNTRVESPQSLVTESGEVGSLILVPNAKTVDARKAVPRNARVLPAGPPMAFNPDAAMQVLRHAPSLIKSDYAPEVIEINELAAYRWRLANDSEFVLMALRAEKQHEERYWNLINPPAEREDHA
jgi:hypothetical protein